MSKQTDALKLALEALEEIADEVFSPYDNKLGGAILAIREALAQPEQEPVAWITDGGKGELWWHQSVKFDDDGNLIGENPDDVPLYTAPPQQHSEQWWKHEVSNAYAEGYEKGRASVKQPEQEPVATLWKHGETGFICITMPDDITDCDARWFKVSDLYTTPPQRKPLSNQKIIEMYNEPRSDAEMIEFARAIEAAHGIWPENSDCYGPDWTDRDGEYLK